MLLPGYAPPPKHLQNLSPSESDRNWLESTQGDVEALEDSSAGA
jgi:hypothetical protein